MLPPALRLPGALVAVDYDGTLAPVVARPEDAVPLPGAVDALTVLAATGRRVVVISGRAAQVVVDLGGLAGVPGLVVLGQYGVERWQDGTVTAEPPVPGLDRARRRLDVGDAEVEDKGRSLVVHTRRSADPVGTLARLHAPLARLAAETGLELHSGRLVWELRPPGHDKGRALRSVVGDATAVLYAGDDRGDVPAFEEVVRLRAEGVSAVAVCSDSPETPDVVRDAADLVVAGPVGVLALLASL